MYPPRDPLDPLGVVLYHALLFATRATYRWRKFVKVLDTRVEPEPMPRWCYPCLRDTPHEEWKWIEEKLSTWVCGDCGSENY